MNTLGPEPVDTLMHYLPPVGWADVATKHDLDVNRQMLEMHVKIEVADVRSEISTLRGELHDALRRQMLQLVTAFAALQTLFIAALKFS